MYGRDGVVYCRPGLIYGSVSVVYDVVGLVCGSTDGRMVDLVWYM